MTTSSTLAHIGLDIGSTTVKLVVLDRSSRVLYARYQRHLSDVRATVAQLFHEALQGGGISGLSFTLAATGSGAIALTEEFGIPCQVSMEERMGCGIGACLVCACDMADGSRKHVCKDGPVFDSKEVDWNA